MAVLTLGALAGLAAAAEKNADQPTLPDKRPIVLSVGRLESIRADQSYAIPIVLYLYNLGEEPVYVSPVPGEIAGDLEVLARPKGSRAEPVRLYSHSHPYSGYTFEDLFRLMPKRSQRYARLGHVQATLCGRWNDRAMGEIRHARNGEG